MRRKKQLPKVYLGFGKIHNNEQDYITALDACGGNYESMLIDTFEQLIEYETGSYPTHNTVFLGKKREPRLVGIRKFKRYQGGVWWFYRWTENGWNARVIKIVKYKRK